MTRDWAERRTTTSGLCRTARDVGRPRCFSFCIGVRAVGSQSLRPIDVFVGSSPAAGSGRRNNEPLRLKCGVSQLERSYKPRTRRSPLSTSMSSWPLIRPARSRRKSRSIVITCETLATESLGRPADFAGISTLPGASTSRTFAVSTTATTVRIRLRLKASLCTIRIGRRNPASDPSGSPRSAHQTWPRSTTTTHRGSTALGVDEAGSRAGSLRCRTRG